MQVITLNIPAAGEWSRDCILKSLVYKNELKISYQKEDDTLWELQCQGVLAFNLAAEEFALGRFLLKLPVEGAFYEIIDSPWIAEMELKFSKNLSKYKHYVLEFYDEIIEIILEKINFRSIKNLDN
jgi:hypothetical protein